MAKGLVARAAMTMNVDADRVWSALTDPAQIKVYLFGTDAVSDWQVGSSITYTGEWQGKSYEDKGVVLEAEPGKKLVSTYWSGMSGKPDVPENYVTVTYELHPQEDATEVVILQDGNANEEAQQGAQANWETVLGSMKTMLEKV